MPARQEWFGPVPVSHPDMDAAERLDVIDFHGWAAGRDETPPIMSHPTARERLQRDQERREWGFKR